jgi:hypothetical protein
MVVAACLCSAGRRWALAPASLLLACAGSGCDVPDHARSTGGVDLEAGPGEVGGSAGASGRSADCARGFVVVETDYAATNVSLLALDGTVRSASFISSGSAPPGLSLALGGDVSVPTLRVSGDELVLLDRYPASVLTWVDLRSASVTGQLSVATGFAANPHDYAELSPTCAYVPRFDANPAPGQQPFDEGNDVLVIDPSVPEIVDRIDLVAAMSGEDERFLPRAERAVLIGRRLYVLLGAATVDLLETASSRLAVIDVEQNALQDVLVLDGLHGCAALAVSPDQDELAVGCSGSWGGDSVPDLHQSGLSLVDISDGVRERERYLAADFAWGPLGFSVAYASDDLVLLTTFGRLATAEQPGVEDALVEFNPGTRGARVLLRSDEAPFSLGAVSCDAACGVCLAADAGRGAGVVHRFELMLDGLSRTRVVEVESRLGLPPRQLGQY